MAMLEIVVRGIGGGFFQISQNSFGMLDSKVAQKAAAVFPEFEVGYLDQVLHQGQRRLAPHGSCAHYGEADGSSYPKNELLPCLVITRFGAETDDVFEGQRRISRRSGGGRHAVLALSPADWMFVNTLRF